MKLTVLGSGTLFSGPERNVSSYLVEGENSSIIVDCGFSALKQLQRVFDPLEVHAFFLTHLHLDHSLGLPEFVAFKKQALYWKASDDKAQLNVFGPPGLKEFYSHLEKALPYLPKTKFRVELKEVQRANLKLFGFVVKSKPVKHDIPCNAYRFEENGKCVAFSGDTGYCDELVEIAKDVDLFVLECTFPTEMERDYHLTPRQCGVIAKKANPKKLLLSHFSPAVEKTDILSEIKKEFSGEIILAGDLMEVRV